jgi:hypothetical protein
MMTEQKWSTLLQAVAASPGEAMLPKAWRQRVSYVVMSAFVTWHSFAIVVAPAPRSSEVVQNLRSLLHPYLTVLSLDNRWNFFAPNVYSGYRLHYIVADADGATHTLVPLDEFNWYSPSFIWMSKWHHAIVVAPQLFADPAVALFCREHITSKPIQVTLANVKQKKFSPQDHLDGKYPFDTEFVAESVIKRVQCPAQ